MIVDLVAIPCDSCDQAALEAEDTSGVSKGDGLKRVRWCPFCRWEEATVLGQA